MKGIEQKESLERPVCHSGTLTKTSAEKSARLREREQGSSPAHALHRRQDRLGWNLRYPRPPGDPNGCGNEIIREAHCL